MKHDEEQSAIGKDEMNLVEFPITLLAKRHDPEMKTLEFSDTIEGEAGKPVKREWTVTGSDKYGLPLAQDNDVLLGLLFLGKEQNFASRKIHFSRYRLCEIMGLKPGGSGYRQIEEAMDRFTGVKIKAKNGFYDNTRKCYVTKHFGIIDSYEIMDSSKLGPPGQGIFPFSYINLSEELFESIQAGYIKSLDMKVYYRLESSITKRLYRYLDKKAYNKKKFEIGLFTLAHIHIGFNEETYKHASTIKQKLSPAHEELIRAGFLKSAEYQKTSDGTSEKVIYRFARKAEQAEPGLGAGPCEQEAPGLYAELLDRLISMGVTRHIAEQILREYTRETVLAQIEALPYRKAEDPAAVLVSSITHGWSSPAPLKKKKQSQARAEAEKLQQEQEERQKAEHRSRIQEYITALAQEELAELTRQARDQARLDAPNIYRDKDVPEYVVTGYLHGLVEKRLKQ